MLRVETFVAGPLLNNIYLLIDDAAGEVVAVDPSLGSVEANGADGNGTGENGSGENGSGENANGGAARERVRRLGSEGVRLTAIWHTHGHFDHVYDTAFWKSEFGAPLWMHRDDEFWIERLREQSLWMGFAPPPAFAPDHWIEAASVMRVGQHAARVLHTPGHSPGSVSFVFDDENLCVSGDVLFRGSVGRTDLPGCSFATLQDSLRKLAALPGDTRILPGHGEPTTAGFEMNTNPFYQQLPGIDALLKRTALAQENE